MQIKYEQDIEILRQKAVLLEKENEHLHHRLTLLTEELTGLKGQDAGRLQLEIELLKQSLERQRRALFGDSSERRPHPNPEPEALPADDPAPRRGHGPKVQPRLPVVPLVHELAESERKCPVCQGELTEMKGQLEESDEITVVQRHFVIVRQQRKK